MQKFCKSFTHARGAADWSSIEAELADRVIPPKCCGCGCLCKGDALADEPPALGAELLRDRPETKNEFKTVEKFGL